MISMRPNPATFLRAMRPARSAPARDIRRWNFGSTEPGFDLTEDQICMC